MRKAVRWRRGARDRRNSFSGLVELNRCVQVAKPVKLARQRFNKRCLAQSDSRRPHAPRRQRTLRRWLSVWLSRLAAGRWIAAVGLAGHSTMDLEALTVGMVVSVGCKDGFPPSQEW